MDWHNRSSWREQAPAPPALPITTSNKESKEVSLSEFLATSDPADSRTTQVQQSSAAVRPLSQIPTHPYSLAFENLRLAHQTPSQATYIDQVIRPTRPSNTGNPSANASPARFTPIRNTSSSSSITAFREHDLIGQYIGGGNVFQYTDSDSLAATMAPVAPVPAATPTVPPPPTVTAQDHTQCYIRQLQSLVLPRHILEHNNYVSGQLSAEKLAAKTRCQRCKKLSKSVKQPTSQNIVRSNSRKRDEGESDGPEAKRRRSVADSKIAPQPQIRSEDLTAALQLHKPNASSTSRTTTTSQPPVTTASPGRCKYHHGLYDYIVVKGQRKKMWSCCNKSNPYEDGCTTAEDHVAMHPPEKIEANWQYYSTPPNYYSDVRAAVAIDCEMGMTKDSETELIRITMIDYFTGEELVDSLVKPDEALAHPNTKYSGVTWQDLHKAFRDGNFLEGKKGAREAVWRYVGLNTIVVAHGGSNDLGAMRWIHLNVVDTHLIEYLPVEERRKEVAKIEVAAKKAEAVDKLSTGTELSSAQSSGPSNIQYPNGTDQKTTLGGNVGGMPKAKKPRGGGMFSLKGLTKTKLGRDIQMAGSNGHCSLEDAIATRDLAHWHVVNKTDVLGQITGRLNRNATHVVSGMGSLTD